MALKDSFFEKYGESEVELPFEILTIQDNYASPFSSGSNGYLTKVRLKNGEFEFYHNWWCYGWLSFEEARKQYPCAACKLENCIKYLI